MFARTSHYYLRVASEKKINIKSRLNISFPVTKKKKREKQRHVEFTYGAITRECTET